MSEVLKVKQVAEMLNTTPQSVRNQVSRDDKAGVKGVRVPPSFKIGARRVWLREQVDAWLREKAGIVAPPASKPGRPTKVEQAQRRRVGKRASPPLPESVDA